MAQCLSPFTKKTGEIFPCGKCYECKARRVSGWSFRIMKEAERSSSAYFITLTYDNDKINITPNGYMTLNYRDVQLFIKKLRKKNGNKIKYYVCGEYGTHTNRPHYHIIIFNATMDSLVGERFARQILYGHITLNGREPFQSDSWKAGYITIGKLTDASSSYTLKYISKNSRVPIHKRDDRVPELARMSKDIGTGYLTGNMEMWHKDDVLNRMYIPLKGGGKIAMPRLFKERIYTKAQRLRISNHVQQQLLISERKKTPYQLRKDMYIRMAKGRKNDENRNTSL